MTNFMEKKREVKQKREGKKRKKEKKGERNITIPATHFINLR